MLKKKKKSFREWLIHKLGGYILDPYDGYPKDYWINEYLQESIFVSTVHCKQKYAENLEKEIARLLAERLIKDGYVRFTVHDKNRDSMGEYIRISGGLNVLKIKDVEDYNTPNHISFNE